jgi:hypothetical protein
MRPWRVRTCAGFYNPLACLPLRKQHGLDLQHLLRLLHGVQASWDHAHRRLLPRLLRDRLIRAAVKGGRDA